MNARADYIIPECYVDTNLVETLVCHVGCNHQKGCNQVAKVLKEKFSDRFAVGIIDADKRMPSYVNEFYEIGADKHLRLLRHKTRPHFLILVNPAIDTFILSCAREAKVNLRDYDLSPNLKEFTMQTKNVMSNKDPRFRNLFRNLKEVGEIRLLQTILCYLCKAQYQASDDNLKEMFHSLVCGR